MIVYTAMMGDFDDLRPPEVEGHFVAFVDSPVEVDGWDVRVIPKQDNPRLTARWCKTHPHVLFPETKVSVWIDGNVTLMVESVVIVGEWLAEGDIAAFAHPARDCAYDEARRCIKYGKGDPEKIAAQMEAYEAEGFPKDGGLGMTSVVARRHTQEVNRFNELWWAEIKTHSVRDQLSFPYVMWKTKTRVGLVPMYVGWAHPAFSFGAHVGQAVAAHERLETDIAP